ncbi:MAG: acyltransferase domain-containing protein, partial [Pseudomonadota bacterium]
QACFQTLSPHIRLEGTRLRIPTAPVPLSGAGPLRAGISGFGVGGTNAHVVLEEAPAGLNPAGADGTEAPAVLPLTARSEAALGEMAARWAAFLAATPESLADIRYTAARRRTHHAHRLAVVGRSKAELADRLAAQARDGGAPGIATGEARARKLAFVFCGQGPQWFAMGRGLADRPGPYREALEACDAALRPHWDHSLMDALGCDEAESRLGDTEIAQPALFALQTALAAEWRARGIVPDAVLGHSLGEITALHVAGALDLDAAARVVAHRGRIMQRADGTGAMAALAMEAAEAAALAAPHGERLSLGAVNAPRSVVLSGAHEALEAALAEAERRGHAPRRLPVRYAFHSAQMEPFRTALEAALAGLAGAAPRIPVYSTVTGARFRGAVDPAYLARNLRETVRFADAVAALLHDGHDLFLEIGPHPVLGAAVAECVGDGDGHVMASLRRDQADEEAMARASGQLFALGRDPDFAALEPAGSVVTLPPYPWQRQRHWLAETTGAPPEPAAPRLHPFLQSRMRVAGQGLEIFEGDPGAAQDWLGDHVVLGRCLLPGAAVMETLAAIATALLGDTACVADLALLEPVVLGGGSAGAATRWQIQARSEADGTVALEWHTETDAGWRVSATARAHAAEAPAPFDPLADAQPLDDAALAVRLDLPGLAFGPSFRLLCGVALGAAGARGTAQAAAPAPGHRLHPALIDAGLQLASLAAPQALYLPVGADHMAFAPGAPGAVLLEARLRDTPGETLTADIRYLAADGTLLGWIEAARFLRVRADAGSTAAAEIYETVWEPAGNAPGAAPAAADLSGTWLLLRAWPGAAAPSVLEAGIAAAGGQCLHAVAGEPDAEAAIAALAYAPAPRGVLLWAAAPDEPDAPRAAMDAAEATKRALLTARALLAAFPAAAPPLTLVSRGGQAAAPGEYAAPAPAALRALFGTLALEHPE